MPIGSLVSLAGFFVLHVDSGGLTLTVCQTMGARPRMSESGSENQDYKRGPKPLYGEKMTKHITIPLPASTLQQLIKAAKKLNRKKTDLARNAIEDFLSFLNQN